MVQDDSLVTNSDGHLLCDQLKALHVFRPDTFHVVVPKNEENLSVKSINNVIPVTGTTHAEVTEVEYNSVLRDGLVPAADKFLVHLRSVGKGPAAVLDYVLVTEVRVGGEPEAVRFEYMVID